MLKEKSLFERLDDISASQTDLLNAIAGVGNKVDDTDARITSLEKQIQNLQSKPAPSLVKHQVRPSEPPMKTFARQAKKSWRWLGNSREFGKAKTAGILTSLLMIILGIVSTIITGISCNMYSPFSGVENIWIVFAIIYFVFACKSPINYEVNAFASGTPLRGERDDTGMVFPNGGEKKVFRIFRWITLVTIAFNIVWIWMHQSNISWLATLVEVLFAASIIVAFFVNINLYAQYCICWLEGKNLVTGQKVTLIKMPGFKSFALEKDVREKIPQLFE